MPNYCENDLYITGPKVAEVLKAVAGEEAIDTEEEVLSGVARRVGVMASPKTKKVLFDFNKIIPMPESMHVESGSRSELALLCARNEGLGNWTIYEWVKKAGYTTPLELCKHFGWNYDEMVALGRQIEENISKYGAPTWYEWSRKNWGTKWNATGEITITPKSKTHVVVKFATAWSPPLPVIKALSRMFPKHKFTLRYYEMGAGFKGRYVAKNGEGVDLCTEYKGNRGG